MITELPITVVVPVGPQEIYKQYLGDCIQSIKDQIEQPLEILVIDDMAHLDLASKEFDGCRIIKNDWLLGCADSWNRGVALAEFDQVFLMGSDDIMLPSCLKDCWETLLENKFKDAWYAVSYVLQSGEINTIPINCALVTKGLWALTNGFPPSAFAGPDALLLSILIKHMPDRIIKVKSGKPNYWIRQHDQQDTKRMASFFLTEMDSIRNKETSRWEQQKWAEEWGEKLTI